ncbi:hypothetical protein HK405_005282, partial [Cladochytrium tenue]
MPADTSAGTDTAANAAGAAPAARADATAAATNANSVAFTKECFARFMVDPNLHNQFLAFVE